MLRTSDHDPNGQDDDIMDQIVFRDQLRRQDVWDSLSATLSSPPWLRNDFFRETRYIERIGLYNVVFTIVVNVEIHVINVTLQPIYWTIDALHIFFKALREYKSIISPPMCAFIYSNATYDFWGCIPQEVTWY